MPVMPALVQMMTDENVQRVAAARLEHLGLGRGDESSEMRSSCVPEYLLCGSNWRPHAPCRRALWLITTDRLAHMAWLAQPIRYLQQGQPLIYRVRQLHFSVRMACRRNIQLKRYFG